MSVEDYSEWLTADRLAKEESNWAEIKLYEKYAAEATNVIKKHSLESVIEFGCGTGWVPTLLPKDIEYCGIDANKMCVEWAIRKNNGSRKFLNLDIRVFAADPHGLSCSFAVMKHFKLDEWVNIVKILLHNADYGLFSMPLDDDDSDDFSQGFPHTFVSDQTLERAVDDAGHEISNIYSIGLRESMIATTKKGESKGGKSKGS